MMAIVLKVLVVNYIFFIELTFHFIANIGLNKLIVILNIIQLKKIRS